LGEQSYSLLRGKKTEDMIFSGSEQRPRAGMASVTVVFDNSEGWLPIDFSDVSVTRRAYRDGQNEYLINGQRVRLKDVSELLAQSGLAERTYTIIGQGVVDAALSLKAEERRRLFEEAAGIGLYRSRREEALRRLETTQRNLERVQDILAELQPRLNSLERQARRAREYEQVRADLKLVLLEWYGYHWHQAQQGLSETRVLARKQEENLRMVRQAYLELDKQMSEARNRLVDLRAALNDWHRQLAVLHRQREELSTQRAVDEERQRALLEAQQGLQGELGRLQGETGLLIQRMEEAAGEAERQENELNEHRTQAEKAAQSLQARQRERQKAEQDLQSARQALAALNRRQGELQARLAERERHGERQSNELKEIQASLEKLQGLLADAQSGLKAADTARRQAVKEREDVETRIQQCRIKGKDLGKSNDTWKEKLLTQDSELARLHAQLDVLEQAERAFSGYAGGVQSLLKAAGEGVLRGVRGVFGSLIEVPVEYETAIAAALSEYLDGLVLDGHDQIEAGIAILEQESVRGVFLPMAESAPDGLTSKIKAGEDVLGVAADLVKVPADLESLTQALLGRTLVVRDRGAARRVLRAYPDPAGLRAVTLHGEVFHSSGPVTAGRPASHAALARPRERKTLLKGIQDGEARLAEIKETQAQLGLELRELHGEETRLEQALVSAQASERVTLALYSEHQSSARSLEGKLQWTQERLDRIQEESQIAEREAAEIHKSLSQLDPLISQAREDVRTLESGLIEFDLDDYQSQAGYWSTQVAVAERALADSQSRMVERKDALEQAGHAIEAAKARLKEMGEAVQALGADKADKRKLEADVTSRIEVLSQQIEPAEIDLARMEQQQDEVQVKEAVARQDLGKAEHNHAQAKINHARRQEALETWRRRIEDDFGLVAFEYSAEVSGPTPLPLDGLVEQLPHIRQISPELEETMRRLQAQLRRMGAINPEAQNEYHEVKQRYEFMTEQVADLKQAEIDVRQVIAELDDLMQRELRRTFNAVAEEFSGLFHRLFGGGAARLLLTDPEDMNVTGIDIEARLPGKRMQGLSLLSGGERSLTATALIFALLKVSPTPFCLLDEVDAMLDETNVGRFRDLVRELSQYTQFIMVTHNRSTVQVADVIYGVTMGRDSTSQVISLKIDEVERVIE